MRNHDFCRACASDGVPICLSCHILANQSKHAPWTNVRQKVNSSTGKNINCTLKLRKFLCYFRFFVPGLSIILAFRRLFNDQEIKECLRKIFSVLHKIFSKCSQKIISHLYLQVNLGSIMKVLKISTR